MPLLAFPPQNTNAYTGAVRDGLLRNPNAIGLGTNAKLAVVLSAQGHGFRRRWRARNIAPGFRRDVTEQMDRKIPWSVKVPQTPSAFTLLPTAAVLAAPVVGSAYPTSPVPTRINGESLEFKDEHVQFASPYSQTWLYSGQDDFRRIVLAYVRIPPADRDTLRAHWKTVKGLVGRFSFTHPVSGESRTMRYARPALEWDEDPDPGYWAGAPIHSLEVELIDAP